MREDEVVWTKALISEFEKVACIVFDNREQLEREVHKLVAPRSVEIQRNRLFQTVKRYVRPEDYENLLGDLTAYIQNGGQEPHKALPKHGEIIEGAKTHGPFETGKRPDL